MKTKVKLILLLISLSGFCFSQSNVKLFEQKFRIVNTMTEDSKGNLWFYPNNRFYIGGFVKYNGTTCNLRFLHGKKTFIPNITETSNNTLLFSNLFKGLVSYDGKEYKAVNKEYEIEQRGISYVFADSKDRVWVFTLSGLAGGRIGEISSGTYKKAKGIDRTNSISTVAEDKNGTLWAGSLFGGFYKCKTNTWEKISNTIITEIRIADDGTLWMGAVEGKIIKYDGSKFTEYDYGTGYFYAVAAAPAFVLGLIPGIIWGYVAPDASSYVEVELDKNNKPWALARKRGLVFIENEKAVLAESKFPIPKTKKATSLFKDHEGNLWVSIHKKGILKYDGQSFKIYTEKDGVPKKLSGVSVDSKGNIWAMSKNLLVKITPQE